MVKSMYNIPTEGCNLEIMGYPFFVEEVSPNESFRRREYNVNNLVGGTQVWTPGAYVGLDFNITTHVPVTPDRPDIHNSIFQEMMSKPVRVISPEMGKTSFMAMVIIKPVHETPTSLKLDINIKEVPSNNSLIPGETFIIPKPRTVSKKKSTKKSKTSTSKSKSKKNKSKKKTTTKKTKSKKKK